MIKDVIHTVDAPAAIGPYSQAIRVGKTVHLSGQIGLDPATGDIVDAVESQAHQVFKNLRAIAGRGPKRTLRGRPSPAQSPDDHFGAGRTPVRSSSKTRSTPGCIATNATSAVRCVAVCTQPCSVTQLRDVVTQTEVVANRGSPAMRVRIRSFVSGSRL